MKNTCCHIGILESNVKEKLNSSCLAVWPSIAPIDLWYAPFGLVVSNAIALSVNALCSYEVPLQHCVCVIEEGFWENYRGSGNNYTI